MYVQIISNNSSSIICLKMDLKNFHNKVNALNFLNNLRAEGQTAIDSWDDICRILESEYVGQPIILSAWKPNIVSSSGQSVLDHLGKSLI